MRRILVLVASYLLVSGTAIAVEVEFTFSTTLGSSAVPGVAAGDTVTLTVIADNGGASLSSQTWADTDVLSAVLEAGTYEARYNPPALFSPIFETDAGGLLTLADFFDIDANNEDSFGVGGQVAFGSDGFRDFNGNLALFSGCVVPPGIGSNCSDDVGLWSVAFVPEPGTLGLLGGALLGLGVLRRKRASAAIADRQ